MIRFCSRCGHARGRRHGAADCPAIREAKRMLEIPEVRRAMMWKAGMMEEAEAAKIAPDAAARWERLFCINRVTVV
jgi:hypothetical protein